MFCFSCGSRSFKRGFPLPPTLRSNEIADSAEFLGMLSEVELFASYKKSSSLGDPEQELKVEIYKRGFQLKPLTPLDPPLCFSVCLFVCL